LLCTHSTTIPMANMFSRVPKMVKTTATPSTAGPLWCYSGVIMVSQRCSVNF
jgi:hypothetical protein